MFSTSRGLGNIYVYIYKSRQRLSWRRSHDDDVSGGAYIVVGWRDDDPAWRPDKQRSRHGSPRKIPFRPVPSFPVVTAVRSFPHSIRQLDLTLHTVFSALAIREDATSPSNLTSTHLQLKHGHRSSRYIFLYNLHLSMCIC